MAIDLLEQIHPQIKDSIYPARLILPDWKMKEGDVPNAASVSLNDKSWTSIRIPFQWGKYDKTYWFRQTFTITEKFVGKPLVLLLDFPEALIYLNGKPFQGIDQHHHEVLICEKSKLNEQFVIAIQAYSGRKNEHNLFGLAELAVLDTTARRLDSGLSILHELEKFLDHGSDESKEVRDLIRRTLVFLKYFRPGSEEYPNAIRRGYNFLLNTLETEHKTTLPGLIHLIGHAHLDVAWTWTLPETIKKCGRTFSTVLRLMEEFPELKFSQSQPVLYDFTKTHYPELYKQIKQRILEGKWEPLGAMWCESDCNLPNGESLIRQILFGKQFFKKEFGIDPDVLWLPDSFGFNWALPQILRKMGVNHFYTSKFSWNDTTKFPYTTFWWQGIDKTKILAHISPLGLEAQVTPKFLSESGDPAQQDPPVSPILQTHGYGDGGGGPTKENLEYAVVLKTIVGLPTSQLSTVQEFFKQVDETQAAYPTWNNELYLETHRGTFTSQSHVKKANRESETLLYTSELLSILASFYGKNASARKYPQAELEEVWKKHLLNQFHDILPGSSIADVYVQAEKDFGFIRSTCSSIISKCVEGISQPVKKNKSEFHFSLFNTLAWKRNAYVEVLVKSKEKHLVVEDAQGHAIEHQLIEKGKEGQKLLCYVKDIPAYGFTNLIVSVRPNTAPPAPLWKTSSHGVETPFYRTRIDSKGSFSSLYAKHLRRELFEKGKHGNFICTFRDTPKQWEAWNIDPEFDKHRTDIWKAKQIKVTEQGPIRATIRIEMKSDSGSHLTQDVYFYHQTAQIDFKTHVRWHEKQTLMKVAFPLNMKASSATYEIQFGAMQRSSKPKADIDKAKFEVPAQQWADISEAKYGVSLLNDCKYGYDAKENTLRLTLLRSPHYPHPMEPSHIDEIFTDQGDHSFCYSIYPHANDWMKAGTIHQARELNHPVLVFPNIHTEHIAPLIESSKPNIIIDSIKKAEDTDELIIRLYEAHSVATDAVLHFGLDVAKIMECNLIEVDEKPHKISKSKLPIKFKPFEIKTLKLTAKPPKKKR